MYVIIYTSLSRTPHYWCGSKKYFSPDKRLMHKYKTFQTATLSLEKLRKDYENKHPRTSSIILILNTLKIVEIQ